MTSPRRFEGDLPALLADLYLAGTPDYRDDLVQQTARVRQRPAWTFPERWLPVDLATKAMPGAPRLSWRAIGVLAILALLLAAMFAVYAGSQRHLPEPFGPAENGLIVFAEGGDIFAANAVTGAKVAIVGGAETDVEPIWSRDGTHFVFERKVGGVDGPGWLFVARDDGRDLVRITPEPLTGLSTWSFSPDGRSVVAMTTKDGHPTIAIVATDGTGQPRFFDVGATEGDGPVQYRPDGTEVLFIGRRDGQTNRGVYALEVSSGEVRTVVAPVSSYDVFVANWSPDGTRIAYGRFDILADGISARTHVASADGSGDFALDDPTAAIADGDPMRWSNDGTRLIITRFFSADGTSSRSVVVPVGHPESAVEIGCPPTAVGPDCTADWTWAPDDSVLVGAVSDANGQPIGQILADPKTGSLRPTPWQGTGFPAWQRVAR